MCKPLGILLAAAGLFLAACPVPSPPEPVADDDDSGVDDDDSGVDDDDSGVDDDDSASADADGDGFGLPDDCDDEDPLVHPGAEELCNGVDDDCDGVIDDIVPPESGERTLFAVIGDFGYGGLDEGAVSAMVRSWEPEFITTTGDNNLPSGSPSTIDAHIGLYYQEFIGNYVGIYGPGAETNRFFPSLGNHEWDGGNAAPHLLYFTLPGNERYFDFVRGSVHFFVIDSDTHEPDGTSSTSVQGQWLQEALASSTSPFQVVYFHHPPYSAGMHGNTTRMQWPFDEWGADIWLAGHDHTYERVEEESGITGMVNGSGGVPLRDFDVWESFSRVQYEELHGAQRVVADDRSITFEFIDVENNLIDSWTLMAGARTTAPSTPLVPRGSAWRYWDQGSRPGTSWTSLGFEEAGWSIGCAPLGYGGDEETEVAWGDDRLAKHITTWFRGRFEVDSVCAVEQLRLRLIRDDGIVVYLNGEEIYRGNIPLGAVGPTTLAASAIRSDAGGKWLDTWLDPWLLQQGENVLAVEVHQHTAISSDLLFDLELLAY